MPKETGFYVITEPCIDVMDKACVDVCPVNCIHTADGERMLFIEEDTCIECGACEPVCPVTAIFHVDLLTPERKKFIQLARDFFEAHPDLKQS